MKTKEERVVSAFFKKTGENYKINEMLSIVYTTLCEFSTFQVPVCTPDIECFLEKNYSDEYQSHNLYVNLNPGHSYYWEVRSREERKLVESCRSFIRKLIFPKQLLGIGSVMFFNNLQLASILIVRNFFMEAARRLCGRFVIAYLEHIEKTIEAFTVTTEDSAYLMKHQPKDFILLCMEKLNSHDYEISKKFHDARVGAVKPTDYKPLERMLKIIERRISLGLVDISKPIIGNDEEIPKCESTTEEKTEGKSTAEEKPEGQSASKENKEGENETMQNKVKPDGEKPDEKNNTVEKMDEMTTTEEKGQEKTNETEAEAEKVRHFELTGEMEWARFETQDSNDQFDSDDLITVI